MNLVIGNEFSLRSLQHYAKRYFVCIYPSSSCCSISKLVRNTQCINVTRNFHSSIYLLAKKGKDKDAKKDDNAEPPKLPDLKILDSNMEKRVNYLQDEFSKIRVGQPSTDIFRDVKVNANGSKISVSDAGQITLKGPTKMTIAVFDPALVQAVVAAIRDCGMGLNPTSDGKSTNLYRIECIVLNHVNII